MSYELAQKYADFKIPTEFKRGYGSINFIKTMLFANEVQLNNDNIDYYISSEYFEDGDKAQEYYSEKLIQMKSLSSYYYNLNILDHNKRQFCC